MTEPRNRPDEALREDVSRLGHLLGDTLECLEGKSRFAHVELARQSARDRREDVAGAHARFARLLSNLSANEATAVSRAFSTYFGLVEHGLSGAAVDLHGWSATCTLASLSPPSTIQPTRSRLSISTGGKSPAGVKPSTRP